MADSILNDTKHILGLSSDYTAFDLDVTMHINSAFGDLNQLDIGPPEGFSIADAQQEWSALGLSVPQLGRVKSYLFLKVKMLFDPPTTSFHIDAMKKQIEEFEWRLTVQRDEELAEEAS